VIEKLSSKEMVWSNPSDDQGEDQLTVGELMRVWNCAAGRTRRKRS
jgi:hypothetical protein